MLTLTECRKIASDHLSVLFANADLFEMPVHSGEYGWVFSYQSRQYIQTNNMSDALIGNSPILVDKNSHEIHILGSGFPVEYYIENYVACGDPFKKLGKRIKLLGRRDGAQKFKAVQAIRRSTDLSLANAKSAIDECLAGRSNVIMCPSEVGAEKLVEQLDALGFCSGQLRE